MKPNQLYLIPAKNYIEILTINFLGYLEFIGAFLEKIQKYFTQNSSFMGQNTQTNFVGGFVTLKTNKISKYN